MGVDVRERPGPAGTATRLRTLMAAEWGRFGGFLLVGGTATILNLGIVGTLTIAFRWSYLPAALIATECGVLLSFMLNDRLTFRRLARGAGHWFGRCLRFHGTYAVGQALTIALGFTLIHVAGWPPLAAQACAIAAITIFNFAMLRFWAYRARRRIATDAAVTEFEAADSERVESSLTVGEKREA